MRCRVNCLIPAAADQAAAVLQLHDRCSFRANVACRANSFAETSQPTDTCGCCAVPLHWPQAYCCYRLGKFDEVRSSCSLRWMVLQGGSCSSSRCVLPSASLSNECSAAAQRAAEGTAQTEQMANRVGTALLSHDALQQVSSSSCTQLPGCSTLHCSRGSRRVDMPGACSCLHTAQHAHRLL